MHTTRKANRVNKQQGNRKYQRFYKAARGITCDRIRDTTKASEHKASSIEREVKQTQIGSRGENARLKSMSKKPKILSLLASTQRPIPGRSKALETNNECNTYNYGKRISMFMRCMHDMAKCN
jgi:hypothetical protein